MDRRRYHAGMTLELTSRQRRWLDALLILSTVAVAFVVIGFVGQLFAAYGDIVLVFFLAWLVSFVLTPATAAVERTVKGIPRVLAVVLVYGVVIGLFVVALLLAAGGLAVFYMVPQWHVALRGTAVVVGLLAGAAVFMTTAKGADTREFLYESRFELRKVVWPTRQETFRTTWIVMIVVALVSLVLAAFDWVISWLVKFALGT